MAERFSPAQILKDLRTGPSTASPPTARQVAVAAEKYPPQFAGVMKALFYAMSDAVMRYPGRDMISRYEKFTKPWRTGPVTDEAAYYLGSLDAYQRAVAAGFRDLSWETGDLARAVARRLAGSMPGPAAVEGLAWRVLLGQVESIYSRTDAAETFSTVRSHARAVLVKDFYRDTGALTYYSGTEVAKRRRPLPTLGEMTSEMIGAVPTSAQAILISVDPNFFRIYAPMILHNAQQVPALDVVIVLCAPPGEAVQLREDARTYLDGLSALNRQAAPQNVRTIVVSTPAWVGNERTFYACARFLALPSLLGEYDSIYATDADMFMTKDPRPFMKKTSPLPFGVTRTEGTLGVSPWRRYMAGSVVANRDYLDSPMRARLEDYLSVGLTESESWMLDQNALAYAVESVPGYQPLTTPRPFVVGNVVGQWERNYRAAVRPAS